MKPDRLIAWGWILVAVIPASIVFDLIVSTIANAAGSQPGDALHVVVNVLVFLAGTVGVIGLPAGIVMLIVGYSQRKKVTSAASGPGAPDTPQPESHPPQQ